MRVEQIVYGTFPFTQGFTLVARSEGVTAEMAQQAVAACKAWGEILTPDFGGALYHLPGDGTHLVGKVLAQGVDAGGRMAWFHQVLLVAPEDFLVAGADLFVWDEAGFFRDRWFENDRCETVAIDAGVLAAAPAAAELTDAGARRAEEVAAALAQGAAVRIQAARAGRSVRALMRAALGRLDLERRATLSVATLAFRPARRYDLWCLYDAGGGEPQRVEDVAYRIER